MVTTNTLQSWRSWFVMVATTKALTGVALRILILMIGHVDDDHFIPLTPSLIQRLLSSYPGTIHKGINALIAHGIIRKHYQSGKLIGYTFIGTDRHTD